MLRTVVVPILFVVLVDCMKPVSASLLDFFKGQETKVNCAEDQDNLPWIEGVYTGVYTFGFEESNFVPCDAFASGLTSDNDLVKMYHTAVDLAGEHPIFRKHGSREQYFVVWDGWLIGPGCFGHMGLSRYEGVVKRVVEARVISDPLAQCLRGGSVPGTPPQ